MRQTSGSRKSSSERIVRNIRRVTRKQYSSEEKIRIVLDGLRGEFRIAELCRREGIAESLYCSFPRHDTPAEPARTNPPDTSPRLPVRAALTEGYRRSHFGPPQPDQPAASVGDYCAAVLSSLRLPSFAHGRRQDDSRRPCRRRRPRRLDGEGLADGAVAGPDQHDPTPDSRGAEEPAPPLPQCSGRGLRRPSARVRHHRLHPYPSARHPRPLLRCRRDHSVGIP